MTGIDDPYEVPASPELTVAGDAPLDATVGRILERLGLGRDGPVSS
jgi:adenylylsulfate kinase-like enzyme